MTLVSCPPASISGSIPLTAALASSASGGVQGVTGTVTARLVSTFREVSPRFLWQIPIPARSVRPRALRGTDLHLESSQSQAGTSATTTGAGAASSSPQGYVCQSYWFCGSENASAPAGTGPSPGTPSQTSPLHRLPTGPRIHAGRAVPVTLTVQSLEHDANKQPEWEKLRCKTWSLCSLRACTSTQGMVS